jgi:nucleotide-binding universal stress UspA family protein
MEMNLQSILVATDFSECSGAAFAAAQSLSARFGAKLILLHVINQALVEHLAQYLKRDEDYLLPELREQAQERLSAFLSRHHTQDLEVESMVAVGTPFQEIAVISRDLAVDLVVLGGYGQRGRGTIDEVFFGSTAEKVVRLLPCPVLCVPLEKQE